MIQQMLAIWFLVPLPFWKFMVHILLKPGLENFEHYFASKWDECNCAVVWTFFGIAFLWDYNYQKIVIIKIYFLPSCCCLVAKSCPSFWQPARLLSPWDFPARILEWEWVAISFSRETSWARGQTCISWFSCVGKWVLHCCTINEA